MSLLSDVRHVQGRQQPTKLLTPDDVVDTYDAEDCIWFAAQYGMEADEWQATTLKAWMGRNSLGKWAAGTCGIAVPRQNGKNGILEMYELFLMVQLGYRILHTAHEVRTARKHFKRIASFFDPELGAKPELAELVKEYRQTNGQEAIFLKDVYDEEGNFVREGGSIEMVARSKGGGRGFTIDVLVLDEAQELGDEALEALKPTLSSAPKNDRQTIYSGTPPSERMNGEVFTRTRNQALAGGERMAWVEWSVEGEEDEIDITDPVLWELVNPALGGRLGVESILDELNDFSRAGFLRERLGRWTQGVYGQVISDALWGDLKVSETPLDGLTAFGIDMNPERTAVSVSAARKLPDGRFHVELVKREPAYGSLSDLVDWIADRWSDTAAVVIDSMSPAASLIPALKDRKVRVTVSSFNDMAKACGTFYDACVQRTISHLDDPGQVDLDSCFKNAKRRNAGTGGAWAWDRTNYDADISPLVAATLALWGVQTTKRKPGRKAVAEF